uniref:Uncharacterized protein n=1 Tax=Romanomermis culicivorax TaxID=13658 RepID=A0A915IA16_ROMCU
MYKQAPNATSRRRSYILSRSSAGVSLMKPAQAKLKTLLTKKREKTRRTKSNVLGQELSNIIKCVYAQRSRVSFSVLLNQQRQAKQEYAMKILKFSI